MQDDSAIISETVLAKAIKVVPDRADPIDIREVEQRLKAQALQHA